MCYENTLMVEQEVNHKIQRYSPQNVYFVNCVLRSDTMSKTQAYGQFHLYCFIDGFINYLVHYEQCSIVQKALADNLEWTCITYNQIKNCCYIAKSCGKLKHWYADEYLCRMGIDITDCINIR